MENATKALIIAGAVLVAIILIGISLRTLNSTTKVTKQVNDTSSALEIATFNAQFSEYFGDNISGFEARALVSKIIVNNAQNPNHTILVSLKKADGTMYKAYTDIENKLNQLYNLIESSATYKIFPFPSSTYSLDGNGYSNGFLSVVRIEYVHE